MTLFLNLHQITLNPAVLLKKCLGIEERSILANSFIHSKFSYCSILSVFSNKKLLNKAFHHFILDKPTSLYEVFSESG